MKKEEIKKEKTLFLKIVGEISEFYIPQNQIKCINVTQDTLFINFIDGSSKTFNDVVEKKINVDAIR